MSNIQVLLLILAGVNILVNLILAGVCFGDIKRPRKPFKAKIRMISIEGLNGKQNN